jgi:hypothetical protein
VVVDKEAQAMSKQGGRLSFWQTIKDQFRPAHKDILQEGALGQAGIHIEKDCDLRPRTQAEIAFQAALDQDPKADVEGLVDAVAKPWGTSYDSLPFFMAYKAGKQLGILGKWLTLEGEDNEKMHEALRLNIQADLMKVDALSYKDEHVNPRSAIVIQTTPPFSMGGSTLPAGLGPGFQGSNPQQKKLPEPERD